jgi:hypothetical protein
MIGSRMSDLPDEGDDSNQLPAIDLCNSWGLGNPILGKGALGNEKTGRMYYQGEDKKKLVEIAQRMLKELGYNLGTSGPNGDGVDGGFGDFTDKAVRQFQEGYKNWNSDPLKIDGLIGPETSDALNREMVGRWYHHYQTPIDLVEGGPYHAVTSEYLIKGKLLETGESKKGKVFIFDPVEISERGGFLLDSGALIQCPHGGFVQLIAPINRVSINGQPVAKMGDTFAVIGCPVQQIGSSPGPQPCETIQWIYPSARVFINEKPVLLDSSIGICGNSVGIITGPAVIIRVQQRVKGV